MRFYEVRAFLELDRMLGFYATTEPPRGVVEQSHGMTYLEARQTYQEMGETMGLERIVEDSDES